MVHLDPYTASPDPSADPNTLNVFNYQRQKRPDDFHWVKSKVMHHSRRQMILKDHPEILELYGPDWIPSIFTTLTVLLQFFMCIIVIPHIEISSIYFWLSAYIIGGTCNHSLTLFGHEVSHDLFFKGQWPNRFFSYFANLPLGLPSMATFARYHAEHHAYLAGDVGDVDLPTVLEAQLVGDSKIKKFIWLILQPINYAVRPLIIRPLPPNLNEVLNFIIQFSFDILLVNFCGWKPLLYLIMSTLLGLSIHPFSGHFLAEHLEFVRGLETYSYYGSLNLLTYNVGYHTEHHDFPKIPHRKLPLLRKIAPEWYDLPVHYSWVKVLWSFIMDDQMNLYCRVRRKNL